MPTAWSARLARLAEIFRVIKPEWAGCLADEQGISVCTVEVHKACLIGKLAMLTVESGVWLHI